MNKYLFILTIFWGFIYPLNSNATEEMVQMEAETSRIVYIERAGTMSQVISADELRQLSDLKVTGNFNSSDVYFINNALRTSSTLISIDMGEANYDSNSWSVNLRLSNLSSIVLPKGITSIGSSAFADCSSLTSITIPNSVIDIGEKAFYKCKTLLNITIPNAITTIGASAFYGCNSLENVVLPNGVTTIGSYAFAGCDNLSLIELPENLTTIRDGAFCDCKKLVSIVFPQGLTSIADRTCNGCFSLVNVEIPEGVTNIGKDAFNGCRSLSSITIPSSATSIGGAAFNGCSSLSSARFASVESMCNISYGDNDAKPTYVAHHIFIGENEKELEDVVIPLSVKAVDGGLFQNCNSIKSVTIVGSSTIIMNNAFSGCKNLKYVNFNGVESVDSEVISIGDKAFASCDSIYCVILPNNVSDIGAGAFANCKSLTEISIPNSVKLIGSDAFNNCSNLTSVRFASIESLCNIEYASFRSKPTTYAHHIYIGDSLEEIKDVIIPSSVTTIKTELFKACLSIESITIPESVVSIESDAFNGCSNLKMVRFASLESLCNIKYGNNGSKPTYSYAHQIYIGDDENPIEDIVVPSSVISIPEGLFRDCKTIRKVTIAEGVEIIEKEAFMGCDSLECMLLSEGLTSIGNNAFKDCSNIESVSIPTTVTSIGDNAFGNIGAIFFTSLAVPQGIGKGIVSNVSLISVPVDAYKAYCEHPNLQSYALLDKIVPGTDVLYKDIWVTALENGSGVLNALGENGVKYVYSLKLKGSINGYDFMIIRNKMPNLMHLDMSEVQIVANPFEFYSNSHTEDHRIPKNAFRDLPSLRHIVFPRALSYIDEYAFSNCSNLREAIIPVGVTGVGKYAFFSCTSLQRLDIPSSVMSIEERAFESCWLLNNISMDEGIRKIDTHSFYSNYQLSTLILPSTIEEIGDGAFGYCFRLIEIVLPVNLREIKPNAFTGCKALKSIHIPPMVEKIGAEAFYGTSSLTNIYVYLANPDDIAISQNTFSTWQTATLFVPSFGYDKYYANTKWGQFLHYERFDEPYETFYTKNTLTLSQETGIIPGKPDALLYEHGSLIVDDDERQKLGDVILVQKGKDSASLIPMQTGNITAENISIDITVQANCWHFFCFPFDVDLSSLIYDGVHVWRRYDGAKRSRREGGWQDLPEGTETLRAGLGYIFQGTKAGTLHLEAHNPIIAGENISSELKTYATEGTLPADASWNFIGTPYTSYYIVDEDTYAAPITVWTGTGYEAYRPSDDDYEFAPYQAFFVQTSAKNKVVAFNADNRASYEGMQAAQSQRRMARAKRKVNPNRLLVNLQLGVQGEEEYIDKTRVVFNDECSLDYESDCDAAKFFSDERRAEFYTIGDDGTQYAINERPEESGYVSLGFVANQKGKYTISAQRMDVPVLLVDDVMETTFDLRNGAYEFSSAKGTFNKRFYLKRLEGVITTIKDLADQIGMSYNVNDGSISIDGLSDSTRVSLYNMAGQQIATQHGNGVITAIPGTYVISVGKLSVKVSIK